MAQCLEVSHAAPCGSLKPLPLLHLGAAAPHPLTSYSSLATLSATLPAMRGSIMAMHDQMQRAVPALWDRNGLEI
ncbi:hypothetical protein KXW36_000463, partial [Aspergillus fumigatus]